MNSIKKNLNDELVLYKTSTLRELVTIPNFQRPENEEHTNKIYSSLKQHIKKQQEPTILGCLIMTKDCKTEQYSLIDGNHRYRAYLKILDECKFDISTYVQTITTSSEQEQKQLFDVCNNNLAAPEITKGVNLSDVNPIVKYFITKYGKTLFSDSEKCKRPSISKTLFSKFISTLLDKGFTTENIIEGIEKYNNELKGKTFEYFKDKTTDNQTNIEKLLKKANAKKFLLGMVRIYQWYNAFGLSINSLSRVALHRSTRRAVWDRYCYDQKIVQCYNCRVNEITVDDFECGHDIANAKGGTLDLSNLYPICRKCNRTMGTNPIH